MLNLDKAYYLCLFASFIDFADILFDPVFDFYSRYQFDCFQSIQLNPGISQRGWQYQLVKHNNKRRRKGTLTRFRRLFFSADLLHTILSNYIVQKGVKSQQRTNISRRGHDSDYRVLRCVLDGGAVLSHIKEEQDALPTLIVQLTG